MVERVPLARWSKLLLEEVFGDRDGGGRPVSTIDADEALFARALARSGLWISNDEAFKSFRSAFPDRTEVFRWLNGTAPPGDALVALLILCCIAASDMVDADLGVYRQRLTLLMQWDAPVGDCRALPMLWRNLASTLANDAETKWRRLILPDPRHRSQIGHAIELTFPSRQDSKRLRRELDGGGLVDPFSPVAVLRWLGARISGFSSSFASTFQDFQQAWRAGDRTLVDHRFWTGWSLAVSKWRSTGLDVGFEIHADEWGRYELVSTDGQPVELAQIARAASAPPALRRLVESGTPIPLCELDWGRLTWCGSGRGFEREARAALIREKSHSASLLAQLDRTAIGGATGWSLTTSVHLLSGIRSPASMADDDLVDAYLIGALRVDGGWLARPSFPLRLMTRGAVGEVVLEGALIPNLKLNRLTGGEWSVTPTCPVEGHLVARVLPAVGEGDIIRQMALRRSRIAPIFLSEPPHRLVRDEQAPRGWTPSVDELKSATAFEARPNQDAIRPAQALIDLVEYFAARPGPMPLGGLCDLVNDLSFDDSTGPFPVIRALLDGGVLEPLRVRGGWRGGAVLPRAPEAILARRSDSYHLLLDGIVNEALFERALGLATELGLACSVTSSLSTWGVPVIALNGALDALTLLSKSLELPLRRLRNDLADLELPLDIQPDANLGGYPRRQLLTDQLSARLKQRGVQLSLCRREADDGPRVWLVETSTGESRPWTHRQFALLDAYAQAGLAPFVLSADRLTLECTEPLLPLQAARWARLAVGMSPGPIGRRYVYPLTPSVATVIVAYLSQALVSGATIVAHAPPQKREGSGGLAVSKGVEISTRQVWRWARERMGAAN